MNLPGPERIVCLTEETTEWLYLLGQERRIVGISGYTVRPRRAREEKPKVSAFLNAKIDKILDLKPDAVFGFSDLQADIAAQLIRAGVQVTVFNQRSVEEIFSMLFQVAAMVGCADEGLARIEAMRQRLELRLQVECDPGHALVDPLRMKQVLFNLLANAVKFTPAGGHVILSLGRDESGSWIKVADSGIGMKAEDIDRVLEPFVQIDSHLSRCNMGTGLGLPLAKRFIELHGGTLVLTSQPGQGTVVTIRLSPAMALC